jgi:hypothetical protein
MTARTIEKITIVVAVTVLGVALAINVRAAPAALLVAALVFTVSAGMDLVLRGEARYHPTADLFILPAALVVGGVLFLQLVSTGPVIVTGLAVFAGLLFTVFWAEHSIRLGLADRRAAETALTAIGYVAAFVLYTAVYQSKARSLISAPAIIAITLLLAGRQFRLAQEAMEPEAPTPRRSFLPAWPRTLLYAVVVALAAGEITWALNYWPLNGLFGGAFLLSAFYFLVGVLSHYLQNRLTSRLVLEYGSVAAAGILVISIAGLLRRGA